MRSHLFGACASQRYTGHCARKLCLAWAVRTFVLALLTISLLPLTAAAQVREVRRVLILNEVGTSHPGMNLINSGITSSLENSPYQLEIYREYLDTLLFSDPADQQQIRASLLAKYRNRKPDVIITIGPSPLRLMAETHESFFPEVPVVFALPNAGAPGSPILDSHFAGVEDAIQVRETVDLALRLQPGSQHLVVVGGTGTFDKQIEAVVREQLRPYENRLDISYLTNLAMPALLEQLKHLPDHTVILSLGLGQDAAGTRFISGSQAEPLVVGAANAPVFTLFDVLLNHGEVGGRVSSLVRDGELAGRMALRALNGEKTQDISVVTSPGVDLFDWRALQRWRLKESNLPAGSTVLYRQLTLWQAYRWRIIAAITLIVLQTLLIFGLLWHRSRLTEAESERRQAEQLLRNSEERLRMATQAGRMFAYEWDAATDKIVHSEGGALILGEDESTHTSQQILQRLPMEDREKLIAAGSQLSPEKPYLQIRHRMLRPDGAVIWVDESSRAYFDEQGRILRIVGMVADTTDRVQAEEALRQKDRELSEAQRLARVGSWYCDARSGSVTWSEELYLIAGLNPSLPAPTHKDEPRHFAAESWEQVQVSIEEALRNGTPYELDLEMVRPDGTTRWVKAHGEPVSDTGGHIVALRGTAQDITERKLAEEALASVSRRLIEAQEQERTRIARELHDNISQRLALLLVEIQMMKENPSASDGKLRNQMVALENRTLEVSTEIQSLSHELHSSKLEYLGLVSAMKSFFKEFGGKHKVGIDFSSEGIPSEVPPEVSLCLFRVMQEGLQNALKHSGVRFFEVELRGSPTEIHLTVRDSGVGFDPELIKDTQGLGLISMQERVRLVQGTISITSRPQSGTEINVRVPLQVGAQTEMAKLEGA